MRTQHYLPVFSCRRGRPIISKIKCLCRWIGQSSLFNCVLYMLWYFCGEQERPYHNDSTASRPLCEVKHCRASLVVWWGTTFESDVLFFLFCTVTFSVPLDCRQSLWICTKYQNSTTYLLAKDHTSFCMSIPGREGDVGAVGGWEFSIIYLSFDVGGDGQRAQK